MARVRITCRSGFNPPELIHDDGAPYCSVVGCHNSATSNPPPRCDAHFRNLDTPLINQVLPSLPDCTVTIICDDGHEEELHGITGITWQVHGNEPVSYTLEGLGAGLQFEAPYDGPRPTSWERISHGNE
jgi:hypothetical protein